MLTNLRNKSNESLPKAAMSTVCSPYLLLRVILVEKRRLTRGFPVFQINDRVGPINTFEIRSLTISAFPNQRRT